MGKQVLVNESSLVNIADALRGIFGETYSTKEIIGYKPKAYISKTKNATSLTTYSGDYDSNQSVYDTIQIPGASRLEVTMAYQTESTSYDYVQVCAGDQSKFNVNASKYGGSSRKQVKLTFNNTDTVTFYFKSDASTSSYLGYYAEVTGYSADGTQIVEQEPVYGYVEHQSIFKPSEMGSVLNGVSIKLNTHLIETTSARSSYNRTIDLSSILPTETTPFFVATAVDQSSGVTVGFYYNGEILSLQEFDYNINSLVSDASYDPSTKTLSIRFSSSYTDRYSQNSSTGMGSLVIWPSL